MTSIHPFLISCSENLLNKPIFSKSTKKNCDNISRLFADSYENIFVESYHIKLRKKNHQFIEKISGLNDNIKCKSVIDVHAAFFIFSYRCENSGMRRYYSKNLFLQQISRFPFRALYLTYLFLYYPFFFYWKDKRLKHNLQVEIFMLWNKFVKYTSRVFWANVSKLKLER